MKIGFCGINGGIFAAEPAAISTLVADLEGLGIDSVWASEHYVLPVRPRQAQAPHGRTALLDPFVALTIAAMASTRLLLATGVVVVPLHHPAILAKKVASVDRASGGRFLFGVGVGYLEEEFAALDADLATRGRRFDDSIDIMTALWSGEPVDIRNPSFSLADVQARPRPASQPRPRLVFGGYAPVSYRRAVRRADGWYGYALAVDAAAACVRGLRLAQSQVGRPEGRGPLEISVTPPDDLPFTVAVLEQYQRIGVDRLVILPPAEAFRGLDPMRRYLDSIAVVVTAASASS